jgi:hypothetical protein
MALHRNLWSPDTCDCQIEYEFDDEVPAEERVHTGKKIVKRCEAHQQSDFTDCHDHYQAVLNENQRKNVAIGHAMEVNPNMVLEDEQGNPRLHPDVRVNYVFHGKGKNRILHIDFENANLKSSHKKKMNTALISKFGSGKVVVE